MFRILLTLYFWLISVISLLITFPICFLLYPFVQEKTLSRMYESIPGYIVLYAMMIPGFWKVKIKDLRKNKNWKQCIIVANHLSFVDSLFLVFLPLKKKFMIAEKFTKIPIFGWLSRMSGHIAVDRNKPELSRTGVERSIQAINKDDSSFALYPEGMRQMIPGQFEKFKTGAFRIAYETKLPILPITLKNTEKAMSRFCMIDFTEIEIIISDLFYVKDTNYLSYVEKTKDIIRSN